VRTFTPIIAGVSNMRYRSFLIFNVVGGVLWGAGVTLLGAGLGQIAAVRNNIEAILVGIVVVSVLPIVVEYLRARKKKKSEPVSGPAGPGAAGSVTARGAAGQTVPPAGPPQEPGGRGRHARR
jgi:membrane-associated protein